MIVCTGVLPWIVLDLIQWKHKAYLRTFVPALSATTFWFGRKKLCFSRTGFVYVTNWKNSENSSISQLCFLFIRPFRGWPYYVIGYGGRAGVPTGFRTITLVLHIESLPNLATWFPCGKGRTLFILGSLGQRSRSPLL